MGADKGKKQRSEEIEEEQNGAELVIDGELLVSIEKLQGIQDDLEKINEEASDKVVELEQKYNVIRKPIYDKRNDIIKCIPDFWLTAFMSHPALSELLTEEDQKMFKYLNNLEVEDFKDVRSGYSITFKFNANPYFEDTTLAKTFTFSDDGVTKIDASQIKWKEGMGIPNGVSEEKKKGKKRTHAEESFFSWFTSSEHKGDIYEIHDEVADIIKDDLWPNPLTYFNNEGEEDFEMDDDEDDDEEKGNDVSEDDEEEDEDDE